MRQFLVCATVALALAACDGKTDTTSLFISDEGREDFIARYDHIVDEWSANREDVFVDTAFGRTHVIHHPNPGKPALLLFHAAGVSAASWFANFDSLSAQFEVLAIDTPGDAGKSELQATDLTVKAYNNWIVELMNQFELTRAIVCGHSIGGFIATNFAGAHPERVEKLIVLAPAATFRDFKWYMKAVLRLAKPGSGPPAEKTLRMQAHESYVLDPDFVDLMEAVRVSCAARMIFPYELTDDEIARVTVPSLVLFASEEVLYDPRKAADRAQRLLPNATVEVVPRSGHTIIMERSDLVNARIVSFAAGS